MMSGDTQWDRFKRIAVTPYWCEGDPLAWEIPNAGIGIAHFARVGKVGHFNLAWWLLARRVPPLDAKVYSNTRLRWVILRAVNIRIKLWSLAEWASFMTLEEWQKFVLANENAASRFEGDGLTYNDLKRLALTGQHERGEPWQNKFT